MMVLIEKRNIKLSLDFLFFNSYLIIVISLVLVLEKLLNLFVDKAVFLFFIFLFLK